MFWAYFCIAVLSLILSKSLYRSYFSPVGIFGGLWNGLLALFEARLIEYYPLSFETHLIFIGSYLLFALGACSLIRPTARLQQTQVHMLYKSPHKDILNLQQSRKVLDVINGLGLLGLAITVMRLAQLVGWDNITDLALVRASIYAMSTSDRLSSGIVGYLSSLMPLNAILAGVYSVYVPQGWKRAGLAFFISLCQASLLGNRTIFIWTTILFFAAYIFTRMLCNHEPFRRSAAFLLLGVILLFVVFGSIGARRFGSTDYTALSANVRLPWGITHAYHYVTSGFGAFSARLTSMDPVRIPGLLTLSPMIRMLARIDSDLVGGYSYDALITYTVRNPSVATPALTNVFTYMWGIFNDFGWLGVLLVPWGMGITSGLVYQRLLLRPTFGGVAYYSFFCLQFVYSSVAVITHANSILVSLAALTLVQELVSPQRRGNVSSHLPVAGPTRLSKQPLWRL